LTHCCWLLPLTGMICWWSSTSKWKTWY
jgi:hypothetical protein